MLRKQTKLFSAISQIGRPKPSACCFLYHIFVQVQLESNQVNRDGIVYDVLQRGEGE